MATLHSLQAVAMAGNSLDMPYRGGFLESENGGSEHRFALTVYFEDTDTAGVVYYANYLKFMERARSDMLRAAGIDQGAILRGDGSAYYVTHVDIRYRSPARLGDDLLVVSKVDRVRATSVHIQQRVMRGQEVLSDATVTAAFLDSGGRPRRQPGDWLEKFQAITTQER
jgi:acyl-CoA thioester hydrolase